MIKRTMATLAGLITCLVAGAGAAQDLPRAHFKALGMFSTGNASKMV